MSAAGAPIPGAVLEIWQTADNGLYSNQDTAQPDYNLRARQTVGADGRYAFTTVRPAPYTVPDDGPVGELLRATGRHPWRPSHLHFIVQADGHQHRWSPSCSRTTIPISTRMPCSACARLW